MFLAEWAVALRIWVILVEKCKADAVVCDVLLSDFGQTKHFSLEREGQKFPGNLPFFSSFRSQAVLGNQLLLVKKYRHDKDHFFHHSLHIHSISIPH